MFRLDNHLTSPIVFFQFCILSSMTEGYSKVFPVSPIHSWLCCVVVKTPDWESVGSEFKNCNFLFFWKENPSLICYIWIRELSMKFQ